MAFNSFRTDRRPPPPKYRTPSPPRRNISPHSSRTIDGPNPSTRHNNGTERLMGIRNSTYTRKSRQLDHTRPETDPQIAMDEFASIALAENSNHIPWSSKLYGWYPQQTRTNQRGYAGRHPKRARSEKLPSPEMPRTQSRPLTSYAQPTEDRRLEAELLLNFSREACFAVPRPPISKGEVHLKSIRYTVSNGRVEEPSTPLLTPYRTAYGHSVEPRSDDTLSDHNDAQAVKDPGNNIASDLHLSRDTETSNAANFPVEQDSPSPQNAFGIRRPDSDANGTAVADTKRNSLTTELSCAFSEGNPLDKLESTGKESLTNFSNGDFKSSKHKEHIRSAFSPVFGTSGRFQGPDPLDRQLDQLTTHGFLEEIEEAAQRGAFARDNGGPASASLQGISQLEMTLVTDCTPAEVQSVKRGQNTVPSVCAACNFSRNALTIETENNATSWISCDACKSWFHFACAGFKSEREVRGVDKYRCRKCKPTHGPTTYVRKSARAHSAIDYAGLNEGVLKTSDENPEHHYIKPIKDGIIKFNPENFARMRPELVTADYFRKGDGMKEPVVIPSSLNRRPPPIRATDLDFSDKEPGESSQTPEAANDTHDHSHIAHMLSKEFEYHSVPDCGQDALDMVIPQNLTVRKISELYGPEEKVEVIDVKSQNGEDRKWNMRRWVDYYESKGNKIVRNVISLEVSQSKLGRLMKRPKVVRDLDLQDSVWPSDLQAKGDYPKVQFYCLMSVADCFTDFHIDFGGSSVFYHILKGKKTFFFIPPLEKHLKKYEEWCMSPAQNWTFLGDQTKECYRVDLSEGDTMLIPAGWIHAVWTPEDSLVIGGNFLTNLHYEMQIRVAQIEKITGVARKFRYPQFQKLLWYTAIKYLEDDPPPQNILESLLAGQVFAREKPTHLDFEAWGENSHQGAENYHAKYYSKSELEGLPELGRYLHRTALIAVGSITEGISVDTRNAVKRSIPKGNGEPLDVVKRFAIWYTWKRGNENIPHWAYPEHIPERKAPELGEKKLSVAALKRLDREAAIKAWRIAPDRQSTRRRSLPQNSFEASVCGSVTSKGGVLGDLSGVLTGSSGESRDTLRRKTANFEEELAGSPLAPLKKRRTISRLDTPTNRGPACETCRKRRRACKHRHKLSNFAGMSNSQENAEELIVVEACPTVSSLAAGVGETLNSYPLQRKAPDQSPLSMPINRFAATLQRSADRVHGDRSTYDALRGPFQMSHVEIAKPMSKAPIHNYRPNMVTEISRPDFALPNMSFVPKAIEATGLSPMKITGRTKACKDCRKSKRRCVHDENGNEDPVKVAEASAPRASAVPKKRKITGGRTENAIGKKSKTNGATQAVTQITSSAMQIHEVTTQALERTPDQVLESGMAEELRGTQNNIELAQQAFQQFTSSTTETSDPPRPLEQVDLVIYETDKENSVAQHPVAFLEDNDPPIVATSPLSELNDLKWEPDFESAILSASSSFQQPHGSSLASPPASTRTDAEQTPPATTKMQNVTPSATSSSSRHSSRTSKTTQRNTPESGTVRRTSGNSAKSEGRKRTDSGSPVFSATVSAQKKVKSRMGSEAGADEESLRLIRELQAQDMGLRRRGRA